MAKLSVVALLTFSVESDVTLPLPQQVADAIDRTAKSINVKEKPGVVLTNVSEQSTVS